MIERLRTYSNRGFLVSFVVFCLLAGGNAAFGQTSYEKAGEMLTLREALSQLSSTHEIEFAFDPVIADSTMVHISGQELGMDMNAFLIRMLDGTRLTFQKDATNRYLIGEKRREESSELHTMVHGKILDAGNHEPLPYAHIKCFETGEIAVSNETGGFAFSFPDTLQEASFQLSYIGFRDTVVRLRQMDIGHITWTLTIQTLEIQKIEIIEALPAINKISNYHAWGLKQDKALPDFNSVAGFDVLRSVQYLPGIDATNDASAGLRIRGSESDETLISLDGITLYNPYHLFGIFSSINGGAVNSFNVYKNNLPVSSGGFTGGMLEMHTHEDQNQRILVDGNVNTLESNVTLRLRPSKKLYFMVSGRSSMGDLGDSNLFETGNNQTLDVQNFQTTLSRDPVIGISPEYAFFDVVAKAKWILSKTISFSSTAYVSEDNFTYKYGTAFTNRNMEKTIDNQELFDENGDWAHSGLSFGTTLNWTNKLRSDWTVSFSSYDQNDDVQSTLIRDDGMHRDTHSLSNRYANLVDQSEVQLKNRFAINDQLNLTFGVQILSYDADLIVQADNKIVLSHGRPGSTVTTYAGVNKKFGERTSIQFDSRFTHYDQTKEWYFEPRISASHWLGSHVKLKGSWGRHLQFLTEQSHENRNGRNIDFWVLANGMNIPVTQSGNAMIGLQYNTGAFEIDIEFFHRNTEGITEHALLAPGFNDNMPGPPKNDKYEIFLGERKAYGMDVWLRYERKKSSNWLSYTLSKTDDKFERLNMGKSFPSENDRRHQVNYTGQYRLKKWTLEWSYVFGSGKPYVDISQLQMNESRPDIRQQDFIQYLTDYHRADISLAYSGKWGGLDWGIKAGIFNLFDRNNVAYRQYIYNIPENDQPNGAVKNTVIGTELGLLGFTPNINLSFTF